MKKTSMMKMISIARKEGQPQTGSTLIDTTTSSSRLATWARLQRLSICGCLMLALICLNLPNVGMGATNLNYMPANAAAQFAATRRLASVGPTLNQAESFLPAGDPRAHYQLLDTSGDGILDPDEAALLMAGDLFNTFQAKQDQEVLPTIKQQQQQHATGDSRHHTSSSQLGSSQSSLPGHYEFEVAPKMEPPGAPKPPFKQANSACPGSDIFGGFSPRHTLCGDLYQGKVPLNPMGQFVNDQAYPFELIKNKTLQFLARSLPILKGEYETIPKVARYLPANQLLNPTSYQSPLGHEHFHALNQLEQQQAAGSQLLAAMSQPEAPPFLRKKRSLGPAGTSTSSGRQQHQQQQASITVAELMPNATLVVSSAHSSAGRIGGSGSGAGHYHHGARSADALPGKHFTMITKDGQRSIGTNNNNDSGSGATNSPNRATRVQNDEQHISQGQTGGGGNRLASQQQQQQGQGQINAGSQHQAIAKSHAANQIVGPSGQLQQQTDTISSREHHQHHAMSPQQTIESKATNSDAAHSNNSNNQRHYQQQQQQQHLQARSVPQSIVIDVASGRQQAGQPQDSQVVSAAAGNDGQIQTASSHRSGFGGGFSSGAARAASKQSAGSGGSPLKCANVNGLLMYTVCQAASALIEPADSTPTWLQAAKQIGTLYAAASNTDSYSAGPTAASPLWALWSALAPGPSSSDKSSSSSSPSATDSSSSSSSEQTSQDIAYKSSNGNHHTKGSSQTPISSVAGVISLLNPLMSFFGPSLQRTGDAGQLQQQSGSSSKTGNKTHNHHHSTTNTGLTSNLKTLSNLLLTGLSIAGLYDWLGTSGIFSPTATTFARRKKPYEAGETFVDTPASLAAMASAKQLSPGATVGAGGAPIKQPPTPCPSVEEYISPTFARNYQGAWKYVVQIPHEGYFTQTIQRSSCMRQKCEFTEGVCHEAPRWVSLLVAEIYYPKAIFGMAQTGGAPAGQPAGLVGQVAASDRLALDPGFSGQSSASMINQLMTASPSTSQLQQVALGSGSGNMVGVSPMPMNANHHLNNQQQQQQLLQHQAKSMNGAHQDPLQMTDSLNNYNHNLNSAFINAATELGLDPTNMAQMQQLANAHNYQFLQRNGFVHTNNQQQQQQYHQQQQQVAAAANQAPAAEPRSSSPNTNQITRQQQQQQYGTNPMRSSPQQQQFVDPMQGQQQQQVFSNDYIKALAIETIRQHPHLSIDDLIKSLQMKQIRKRRDLATAASSTSQQLSSAQHQQQQQALSSMAPLQHHQQQQQQHYSQKLDSLVQQANQNQIARSSVPPPQQNPSLSAESSPSINELGMEAAHLPQQQQQQHPQQYQQQAMSTQSRSNQLDQQQQTSQMLASQAQASLAHDITSTGTNQQHSQQANNNNPHQHHHHHHTFQADQQTPPIDPSSNAAATSGLGQTSAASSPQAAADSQTECDGHDKIGCYVVRVYYDWFLVNGSCKCWKTNTPDQQQHSGQSSSSSAGGGSSSGSAGFIRRIFTG